MLDILTIAGSPSATSRSTAVLEYLRQNLEWRGLRTKGIAVRDLPAEDLLFGRSDSPAIVQTVGLLSQARAVIVATPVYKTAYSGVLKIFLDLLPPGALVGKLVLPIATGGSPVHMLAIDYALRPVLTALGAYHTLQGIYIVESQIQLGEGLLDFDPAVAERLDGALHYLAAELGGVEAATGIRG